MNKKAIWTVVLLIGGYVVCQIIADVGATKFIEIGGIVMPAGTFVFALTFTLRDMVHKRLGKQWALYAIWAAAGFNLFLSLYLWLMAQLPSPAWFELSDSWNAIFAITPAIVLGSIIAEMVSESVDTEIYHYWANKFKHLPQWSRVLVSNVISIPIDTLIFSTFAFVLLPSLFGAEPISFIQAITEVSLGQVLYKGIVAIVSIPGIYLVKEKVIEWQPIE